MLQGGFLPHELTGGIMDVWSLFYLFKSDFIRLTPHFFQHKTMNATREERFLSEDHEANDKNRLKSHSFLLRLFRSLLRLFFPHLEVECKSFQCLI